MKSRDRDYIEDRLLAPAIPLNEAIERLFETGEAKAAEAATQLSNAAATLTDECREARKQLWYPERNREENTP